MDLLEKRLENDRIIFYDDASPALTPTIDSWLKTLSPISVTSELQVFKLGNNAHDLALTNCSMILVDSSAGVSVETSLDILTSKIVRPYVTVVLLSDGSPINGALSKYIDCVWLNTDLDVLASFIKRMCAPEEVRLGDKLGLDEKLVEEILNSRSDSSPMDLP